jgi:hypothetical protein
VWVLWSQRNRRRGGIDRYHFHPSSQGGADDSSNWVYCCHACNEFKDNYWQPDSPKRILNPVADNFAEHFEESADGVLHGLTETGRFFIKKLRLNRDALVAHRIQRAQTELMRQHQLQLKDRLEELEAQLHELLEQVDNLRSND